MLIDHSNVSPGLEPKAMPKPKNKPASKSVSQSGGKRKVNDAAGTCPAHSAAQAKDQRGTARQVTAARASVLPVFTIAQDSAVGRTNRSLCSDLLAELRSHELAVPFLAPVDVVALKLNDYLEVIKKPMDLQTVDRVLRGDELATRDHGAYNTVRDFVEGVQLVFSNAMLYNSRASVVHQMAARLSRWFDQQFAAVVPLFATSDGHNTRTVERVRSRPTWAVDKRFKTVSRDFFAL